MWSSTVGIQVKSGPVRCQLKEAGVSKHLAVNLNFQDVDAGCCFVIFFIIWLKTKYCNFFFLFFVFVYSSREGQWAKASLHPPPEPPVRLALATHLSAIGVLTHSHSVSAGDDGNVVVHVEDADGDGDVIDHPGVIWKIVKQKLEKHFCLHGEAGSVWLGLRQLSAQVLFNSEATVA